MQTNKNNFKVNGELFLTKIDEVISNISCQTEILQKIMDITIEAFDCDRAYILYPCDPNADSWSAIERSKDEYPGVCNIGQYLLMDESIITICNILLKHDGVIAFGPNTEFSIPETLQSTFDIQSQLSMLITSKNDSPRNFGIHQCSYPRVWKDEEKKLLYQIGERINKILENN
jgi:hypothetical protein